MIEIVKIPLEFNIEKTIREITDIDPGYWVEHFNRGNYVGGWSILPLRSIDGEIRHIYSDPNRVNDFEDTIHLKGMPYTQSIIQSFKCQMTSVRFMNLKAGARIKEHRDHQLGLEDGEARLHIPITTDEQVEFVLNGQVVGMSPGETWYLNFNLPHRVENNSTKDRIHLVMDCIVNPWLVRLISGIL